MTVNRNEERVAEGTSGSGPSRPVGNKLTQVAGAGRQALGKVLGAGKKLGKERKLSKAERSKDAASGRKRRFFNYPRAGKGKIHRWIPSWRFVLGVFLLGVLSTIGAFIWAYNTIKVPKPSEFALAQSSTVYYADGTEEMGKFAEINRQSVDASTLPDYVGNAVVASEDRTFYSNKGVDPKGIARALFNNLRGGDTQGPSTLTQQYVKNYYVDTTSSYSGKFKQAIMAIKIDREKPKKEILGDYLNTVYYGRGAYGIEAASQAFFEKPAKDMSPSEAALLAGILPSPSAWDPAENPDKAQERWGRVLQFMLDDGYITQAQYNEAKQTGMPKKTKEPQTKQVYSGTNGYLLQMVRSELESKAKLSPEQIDTGGFKIVTTINKKDQEAAVNAVKSLPPGASPNLHKALVSIDPKTGGLLALYGGDDYLINQVNTSTDAIAQAGSTFKPFALVAALDNGWSLESGYPATSPMTIEGHEFQNFKNVSLKWASLTQATEQSLNTPYLQLNQELMNADDIEEGVTAKVANRAGYPENTEGLKTPEQRTLVQNVLGSASPHTIDIATAYSTFAAQGIRRDTHIVASLKNPDGKNRYTADTKGHREFDEDVMADTTYALQQVVNGANGSANKVAELDRPVAAKTGSSSDNKSAQFVGFTPQVVTAVTLYQSGTDGTEESIEPWGEYDEITGSTYPADIFVNYMTVAHEGLEVEDFPPAAGLLATRGGTDPQTTKPTGEPEDETTATPTAPPEATTTPTPQSTAEPTPQGTPRPEGEKTDGPDSRDKSGGDQDGSGDNQGGGGNNRNPGGDGQDNGGQGGGGNNRNPGGDGGGVG